MLLLRLAGLQFSVLCQNLGVLKVGRNIKAAACACRSQADVIPAVQMVLCQVSTRATQLGHVIFDVREGHSGTIAIFHGAEM